MLKLRADRIPAASAKVAAIAFAYDQAGPRYAAYADGEPSDLFAFGGLHGYADRVVWRRIRSELVALRQAGRTAVTLLDLGCGPGTWLRRIAICARGLGFTQVTARGIDISAVQIRQARLAAQGINKTPGLDVRFDVGDVTEGLPEADGSVDIALCLYSVMNHLPCEALPGVADEIARVTRGRFLCTVRPVGSTPTAFVDSMEKVVRLRHDHASNSCEVVFSDGRRVVCDMHLFTASELRGLFARRMEVDELCGLDLFHSRFAPDPRWNPASLKGAESADRRLDVLEEAYARAAEFMDRAVHLLLVARPQANTQKTRPDGNA